MLPSFLLSSTVVDLHDVLLFDGHVCLVLELMKATLFDLYGSFKIRSEPELLAVPSPQPPMQFVHPRYRQPTLKLFPSSHFVTLTTPLRYI